MKALKIVSVLMLVYVGIVIIFESMLGYFQPSSQTTLVITTTDESGTANSRVLASLSSDQKLYVSANHWPRQWYKDALARPNVEIEMNDTSQSYVAVKITDDNERNQVAEDNPHPVWFTILVGFAPREFLRLDERG